MKQISEEDLAETLNDTGCYPTQESIKEDIAKYYEDCHCDRIPRLEKWLTRCGELISINRRKYQEERLRADDLQGRVQDYRRALEEIVRAVRTDITKMTVNEVIVLEIATEALNGKEESNE